MRRAGARLRVLAQPGRLGPATGAQDDESWVASGAQDDESWVASGAQDDDGWTAEADGGGYFGKSWRLRPARIRSLLTAPMAESGIPAGQTVAHSP